MESEDKSATSQIVKTETAAAVDLVLGIGIDQETGEPPDGAGAMESVELESEDKPATT